MSHESMYATTPTESFPACAGARVAGVAQSPRTTGVAEPGDRDDTRVAAALSAVTHSGVAEAPGIARTLDTSVNRVRRPASSTKHYASKSERGSAYATRAAFAPHTSGVPARLGEEQDA